MKVVLVSPPVMDFAGGRLKPIAQDESRESPPYGIYLLSSVLKRAGHDTCIVDLIAAQTDQLTTFAGEISDAHLVGVGTTSLAWPAAVSVINQLRRLRPDVPIVLGGIHASMFDTYLLSSFPVQYIIRGEGEEAFPLLCAAIERGGNMHSVPNLSWKDGEHVVRNPIAPKIGKGQLSDYPLPDYGALPTHVYKGVSLESSRGCAFDCSFCSTSYRLSWRGMTPEAFVDRLEGLAPFIAKGRFGTTHIIDDEFSMNPRRAIDIAETIRERGLRPKLVYDSRANDLLFDGYVASIAEFTHQFLVGAECGYDEGLKKIGKGTTCDSLERAAAMLERHGIAQRADFSFIMGLPWEDVGDVEKTLAFATHLYSTYGVRVLLQWYCQIPGSRLWEADFARGAVSPALYNDYGFFRNLYLFRSGVRLTPAEVWDIEDRILSLQWLASLANESRKSGIENAFPQAIAEFFPRSTLPSEALAPSGLISLREISRPSVPAGIPQRHSA
jgi:anaerobic magnesium-protoporphyrin IX monomethyl ester cyclase